MGKIHKGIQERYTNMASRRIIQGIQSRNSLREFSRHGFIVYYKSYGVTITCNNDDNHVKYLKYHIGILNKPWRFFLQT